MGIMDASDFGEQEDETAQQMWDNMVNGKINPRYEEKEKQW